MTCGGVLFVLRMLGVGAQSVEPLTEFSARVPQLQIFQEYYSACFAEFWEVGKDLLPVPASDSPMDPLSGLVPVNESTLHCAEGDVMVFRSMLLVACAQVRLLRVVSEVCRPCGAGHGKASSTPDSVCSDEDDMIDAASSGSTVSAAASDVELSPEGIALLKKQEAFLVQYLQRREATGFDDSGCDRVGRMSACDKDLFGILMPGNLRDFVQGTNGVDVAVADSEAVTLAVDAFYGIQRGFLNALYRPIVIHSLKVHEELGGCLTTAGDAFALLDTATLVQSLEESLPTLNAVLTKLAPPAV